MIIDRIRIQNFRSFKDETVRLHNFTALVGTNGAGKSTVLSALNVFFREQPATSHKLSELTAEDAHHHDTSKPIIISLTFVNLTEPEQEAFKAYYRQGELTLEACATFHGESKVAPVEPRGSRRIMKDFAHFFKMYDASEKVGPLRNAYATCRSKHGKLPDVSTKERMRDALRHFEEEHPELCAPHPSQDKLYGATGGKWLIDKFVQWVHVPAVKDAASEAVEGKGNVLTKLVERTVRSRLDYSGDLSRIRSKAADEYAELLSRKKADLHELGQSLERRLKEWAHHDARLELDWNIEQANAISIPTPKAEVQVGETGYLGHLSRLGHGLQRSYLCAVLQELAGTPTADAPQLVLSIEEPELYQHPPQAAHLASVLRKLSLDGAQVILCTHSPQFVSGEHVAEVRRVRFHGKPKESTVSSVDLARLRRTLDAAYPTGAGNDFASTSSTGESGLLAQLSAVLHPQLSEMFFANVLILVEGIEDASYLKAAFELEGKWGEYGRLGCHIVHTNGKSKMIRPLAVATDLEIPTFCIYDADTDQRGGVHENAHKAENKALATLCGHEKLPVFPSKALWRRNLIAWPTCLTDVVKSEVGPDRYEGIANKIRTAMNQVKNLNKNPYFIAALTQRLWAEDAKPPSLLKACDSILQFAVRSTSRGGNSTRQVRTVNTRQS